ncbi:hypothetical protein EUGRSUZ_L01107 [Eucalyptus grandis]|uniref:Cytochrome P450 n=1 Tax=Eucalyptus grandis TaxID=71139 RepID=A0A058ZW03_EUCGR|nr:hypothetical protein EUGRSUZ_L01107 [Eucalyptus grandis]
MVEEMWFILVNLPFTCYYWSLYASSRVQDMLKELVQEKKVKLAQHAATPHQDLIMCFLSKHNEENEQVVTDKEILHITLVMIARHDTSSVLITFVLRLLYKNPTIYKAVPEEEIAKSKTSGESLTWADLARMKLALRDIDYCGYLNPKGWQVFWASNMTHKDESIFPEPSEFDPARFKNQKSIQPYGFILFGGGPRVCPGSEFARIETLVPIHYLVTKYYRDPLPVPTQGLLLWIVPKIQE